MLIHAFSIRSIPIKSAGLDIADIMANNIGNSTSFFVWSTTEAFLKFCFHIIFHPDQCIRIFWHINFCMFYIKLCIFVKKIRQNMLIVLFNSWVLIWNLSETPYNILRESILAAYTYEEKKFTTAHTYLAIGYFKNSSIFQVLSQLQNWRMSST